MRSSLADTVYVKVDLFYPILKLSFVNQNLLKIYSLPTSPASPPVHPSSEFQSLLMFEIGGTCSLFLVLNA